MKEFFESFEGETPPPRVKGTRERTVERPAVSWATARGWWQRKYKTPGNNGVPDRQFVKKGKHLYVEFKRPGKEPTDFQEIIHGEMRQAGMDVQWADDLGDFKKILANAEPS